VDVIIFFVLVVKRKKKLEGDRLPGQNTRVVVFDLKKWSRFPKIFTFLNLHPHQNLNLPRFPRVSCHDRTSKSFVETTSPGLTPQIEHDLHYHVSDFESQEKNVF